MDKSSRRRKLRVRDKSSRSRKSEKESRKKSRKISRKKSPSKESRRTSRRKTVTIKDIKFSVVKNRSGTKKLDPKHVHVMITTKAKRLSTNTYAHSDVVRMFNTIFSLAEIGSNGGYGDYWTDASRIYDLSVNPLGKYVKNGKALVYVRSDFRSRIDFLPV